MGIIEKMQAEIDELKERLSKVEKQELGVNYLDVMEQMNHGPRGLYIDFEKKPIRDEVIENHTRNIEGVNKPDDTFYIFRNDNSSLISLFNSPRKNIIEKAKRSIELLKRPGKVNGNSWEYREFLDGKGYGAAYNVTYIPNKEKRTVVALLRGYANDFVLKRGVAKCDPDDCFNVHIGKAIALHRALGLEVPNEFYYAPQPTERKVGDVIKHVNIFGEEYTRKIKSISKDIVWYTNGNWDGIEVLDKAKIIDDSHEGA